MKGKEGDIQKAVLEFLRIHPSVAWCKVNTVGKVKGRGGHWMTLGYPGEADITGQMKDGRFLAIEIKMPGEKPSQSQLEFLNMIKTNNGVAGWTDSIDGAKAILGANTNGA